MSVKHIVPTLCVAAVLAIAAPELVEAKDLKNSGYRASHYAGDHGYSRHTRRHNHGALNHRRWKHHHGHGDRHHGYRHDHRRSYYGRPHYRRDDRYGHYGDGIVGFTFHYRP